MLLPTSELEPTLRSEALDKNRVSVLLCSQTVGKLLELSGPWLFSSCPTDAQTKGEIISICNGQSGSELVNWGSC